MVGLLGTRAVTSRSENPAATAAAARSQRRHVEPAAYRGAATRGKIARTALQTRDFWSTGKHGDGWLNSLLNGTRGSCLRHVWLFQRNNENKRRNTGDRNRLDFC